MYCVFAETMYWETRSHFIDVNCFTTQQQADKYAASIHANTEYISVNADVIHSDNVDGYKADYLAFAYGPRPNVNCW